MNRDVSDKHTFVICAYKESQYLEECIRSVVRQRSKSSVIMSTGTPNAYIKGLAEKYNLQLFINENPSSLANDWNFAIKCADTELVTLAHQDDIYETDYSQKMVSAYQKAKNPIILFSDYCELRNGKRVLTNRLLKIKRVMLLPLRIPLLWKSRFVRRRILSFGSPICCPSVTFVKKSIPEPLFVDNMKGSIDWQAWELLSRKEGTFVYVSDPLMAHRIHEESTTSELVEGGDRSNEDLQIFRKFWPEPIARMIEKVYRLSEDSNSL